MATNPSNLQVNLTVNDQLTPELARIQTQIIRAVGAISASIAAIRIGSAPITAAAEFERELANVQKTTNFTRQEIEQLSNSLLSMSLRVDVAATDLAKIAAAAGQQGLGREGVDGVRQFTESVSRMASVLDITAEDAATNIGKIANVFKIPLRDIERAVSTFNEVSNNSTAQGEELLDVVKRIGDAAGSLNLQQATALAATGLDFGQSPEVVGTAYAKVFSSMFQKADQFAKLLKMPVEQWLQFVQADGFAAYRQFLAGLRTLDAQSQQNAIVKLIGGGRLGALINKQVQDTADSVLQRNFASAQAGNEGLSAIREQATILNTLEAQAKILQNSITKLGIDAVDALIEPLTQWAAQLSEALQGDGFKNFFRSVAEGIGSIISDFVEFTKWVATLNVNWANLITVAEVFAKIKIAQAIGGWITRFSAFGVSLQTIANGAKGAQQALTATGTAATAAAAASAQGATRAASAWRDLFDVIRGARQGDREVGNAQRAQQTAAARAIADAQRAAAAQRQAMVSAARSGIADNRAGDAAQRASQASQQLRQQIAAQAAAEAALRQQYAARIQQAERTSAADRLAIEQEYQTRRRALTATGSRAGLTALQRERTELLAAEAAHHAASLQGVNTYWTARIARERAGAEAATLATRQALMRANTELDDALANRGGANARAAADAAAAAAAAANAHRSAGAATAAGRAAELARKAFTGLGAAIGIAATALGALARIGLAAFGWISLIYMAADAFGLLDKVPKIVTRLTDALGLTSAKSREAAVEARKLADEQKELTKSIEEQTEKFKANADARGMLDTDNISTLYRIASTTDDPDRARQANADAQAIVDNTLALADNLKKQSVQQTQQMVEEQTRIIAEGQAELARINLETQRLAGSSVANSSDGKALKKLYEEQARAAEDSVNKSKKKLQELEQGFRDLGETARNVNASLAGLADVVSSRFTATTASALSEFVLPLVSARQRVQDLTQAMQQLNKENAGKESGSRTPLTDLNDQYKEATSTVFFMDKMLKDFIVTQKNMPGISPEVAKTFDILTTSAGMSVEQVKELVRLISLVDPKVLAGQNAGRVTPPDAKGTNTFSVKDDPNERAKSLRQAELALAKAEIDARNKFLQEQNQQEEMILKDRYDRGLVALNDYYDARKVIQNNAITLDQEAARLTLNAINREIAEAQKQQAALPKKKGQTDTAAQSRIQNEILRLQADQVRTQGELDLLEAQRRAIDIQISIDRRAATEAFNERVRSETASLASQGFILKGIGGAYEAVLNEAVEKYKIFIKQLRDAGKVDLANVLEEAMKFQAYNAEIQLLSQELELLNGSFSRFEQRLGLLRKDNKLTTIETELAYTNAIKQQLPLMQELIDKQRARLSALNPASNKLAYEAEKARLDELILRMESLSAETDKIAKSINEDVGDAIANALGKIGNGVDSLGDILRGLIVDVARTVQQVITRDLSEEIMRMLLPDNPAGGIGGWVQGMLQGGRGGTQADLAQGRVEDVLGRTAATAMYVRDVNTPVLSPGSGKGKDTAGELVRDTAGSALMPKEGEQSWVTQLITGVQTGLNAIVPGLGNILTGLANTLGSILTSLFSGLGGTSGSLVSWLGSSFGLLHSGGIAGLAKAYRRVSPLVFAGAPRYHNGGIAGLKPNEVPTILKKGEEVLTERDERHQNNLKSIANNSPQVSADTRIVNVIDPTFARDFMESSEGERVILNVIRNNSGAVSQIFGR